MAESNTKSSQQHPFRLWFFLCFCIGIFQYFRAGLNDPTLLTDYGGKAMYIYGPVSGLQTMFLGAIVILFVWAGFKFLAPGKVIDNKVILIIAAIFFVLTFFIHYS